MSRALNRESCGSFAPRPAAVVPCTRLSPQGRVRTVIDLKSPTASRRSTGFLRFARLAARRGDSRQRPWRLVAAVATVTPCGAGTSRRRQAGVPRGRGGSRRERARGSHGSHRQRPFHRASAAERPSRAAGPRRGHGRGGPSVDRGGRRADPATGRDPRRADPGASTRLRGPHRRHRRAAFAARPRHLHLGCVVRGGSAGGRRRRRRRRVHPGARRACRGPGAAAGSSRRGGPGHGLLPVQQRGGGGGGRPLGGARPGRGHRLRRSPRERHPVDVLRGPRGAVRLAPPVPLLSGDRRRRRRRPGRRARLHP